MNETDPLIKTTWENKKKNYTVTVEHGDDDGEDDEFEEGKIDECSFEENVFFPESQKLHTGNKNFCEEYNFYKNAAFLDGLVVQPHLEVTVHGNLYVDGFLEVKGNSEVTIEKDLYITGDIREKGKSSLNVIGTIFWVDDFDDVEGIPDMED